MSISRDIQKIESRKRRPKHAPKPSADPLVEARQEAKSLRTKVARLQDENARLHRELRSTCERR